MIADEIRALAARCALLDATVADAIFAIADRVEAVERDAERWAWFKANCGWERDGPDNWKWYTLVPFSPEGNFGNAAIDAAIKEQADATNR